MFLSVIGFTAFQNDFSNPPERYLDKKRALRFVVSQIKAQIVGGCYLPATYSVHEHIRSRLTAYSDPHREKII